MELVETKTGPVRMLLQTLNKIDGFYLRIPLDGAGAVAGEPETARSRLSVSNENEAYRHVSVASFDGTFFEFNDLPYKASPYQLADGVEFTTLSKTSGELWAIGTSSTGRKLVVFRNQQTLHRCVVCEIDNNADVDQLVNYKANHRGYVQKHGIRSFNQVTTDLSL